MPAQILDALSAEHFGATCRFWNSRCDWFLQRDLVKLHHYNGSLHLVDLTHAMQPGHTCDRFVFRWWPDYDTQFGLGAVFARHQFQLRALLAELLALPWQRRQIYGGGLSETCWQEFRNADLVARIPELKLPATPGGSVELYREADRSIRTYSPFVTVKPLRAAPHKWTVAHVVRALLAGQFTDLKCHGVYTDDYAFDAAVNFQQGQIRDAIAFARRIMESPSGWWASTGGEPAGIVSICCHHFDSNSFRFQLEPQTKGTPDATLQSCARTASA